MTKFDVLKKDPCYNKWIEAQRVSKNSIYSYSYALQMFSEFTGLTPEQLVTEAREDAKQHLGTWEIRAIEHYEGFVTYLKKLDGSLSDNYKHLLLQGVKNFYRFYKVPIISDFSISARITDRYRDIKNLKMEDIRKAVQMCGRNKMIRAMIICLVASGQGQAELRALKGYHLKNVINNVVVVRMARHRSKKEYFFFLNQEAVDAVHEYKKDLKDGDYIFTQVGSDKPLSVQEFDAFMRRHAERCGLDPSYIAPHRIRHFWKNALQGYITQDFIEFLMGHRLVGSQDNYFEGNANLNKMIAEYIKHQDKITITLSEEKLQKAYDDLKEKCESTKIENIQRMTGEIEELKKQIETMREAESCSSSLLSMLLSNPETICEVQKIFQKMKV